jgi:hypothetical protein
MADYNLGTAHGSIKLDADTSGIDQAQRSLRGLDNDTNSSSGSLNNLNRASRTAAGGLSVVSGTLAVMAVKASVATVAGAGLVAIALELSGVLGLIPAAGVAGGLALGALAVGMNGFADAMKNAGDPEKFAESLKTLAPEARETARGLRSLRDEWTTLRKDVQNRLFEGTNEEIQDLAGKYLPMLQGALGTVAGSMNLAFRQVADSLETAGRQADLQGVLNSSATSVGHLTSMIAPLVSVFLDLAVVGAPIMERLAASASDAVTRFAEFISTARQTGQLQDWIERGLQAFRDLWTIVSLLTGTVMNLVHAFGGPDSLLGVLLLVAQALNVVSGFIRDNIGWIGPLAGIIGSAVAAYKIWTAAVAVHTAVTGAWATATNSAFLRVIAAQTLATLKWIGNFLLMTAAGAAWVAVQIVQAGVVVARWAWMALMATLNAARAAAAWLLIAGPQLAVAVAQMIAGAAVIVAQWALMAVQAMARAVIMAAAWFIALGPIGWAIAALIAVIAFVIIFWDEIKAAFQAAGEWLAAKLTELWNNVVRIWNNIIGWFKQIPGWIGGIFSGAASWLINAGLNILQGLWNGVRNMWNSFWGWVRGIPGWIGSIFSGAGSWLMSVGGDLIRGLWNGITGMFNWVMGKIRGFASSIVSGIKNFFGIGSPSKLFADEVGKWIPPGISMGIDANADEALKAAAALVDGVRGVVSMAPGGPDAFWDGRGTGPGYVPPSPEVASYAASQGDPAGGASPTYNFNTYNPVAERASDSEARRLRALSSLGAF